MSKKVEIIIGDYPNNVSLDLTNDSISIALQYSIDDIRDIDKKNTNHSKTVKLAGTKKNNIAFGGLFDINSTFDKFNPNNKVSARILVDSSPVLEGYLQLLNVNKTNTNDLQGNSISYDVVIFDDSIDFIQTIGDKEVSDLDFSSLNHTYGKTAIENAWANHDFNDVYQYPMLDKSTEGYFTEDFKPAFYHKSLLLKIAEDSGYSLEGSFIDSNTQYEREIIGWDGNTPTIKESEAINREFKAGLDLGINTIRDTLILNETSLSTLFVNSETNFNDITSTGFFDNTTGYSFAGGVSKWVTTNAGRYNFNTQFKAGFSWYGRGVMRRAGNTQVVSNTSNTLKVRASLVDAVTGYVITSRTQTMGFLESLTTSNASDPKVTKVIEKDVDINFNDVLLSVNQEVKLMVNVFNDVSGSTSDKFAWTTGAGSPYNSETVILGFYLKSNLDSGAKSSFSNKVIRATNINDGDQVELSLYLPKDIKQKDILTDVVRRYNVYIRKHATKTKTLVLESRDDYYSNNPTVLNWTQKKDYNTDDKIQFLSDLQNKEILFTYKEANDIVASDGGKFNESYNLSTGDIYGQKKISFNNDFVKGTKKIESIFSTVPLVYRGDKGNDVVVPAMNSAEGKRKPVLLYWGGLTTIQDENSNASSVDITFGTNAKQSQVNYPYAGHYNNPYNPTLDIHFGAITYEYYGVLLKQVTDKNLFNDYWRNYYNQIGEGKLITSKFYLKETDINFIKDNLNSRIFVKDSYYIINKIIDYKPLEDGLTTVELSKISEGSTFTPTIGTSDVAFTAIDQIILTSDNTTTGSTRSNITNRSLSNDSIIVGYNNRVESNAVAIVNGNDNTIGGDSVGVSVTGSNNIVSSGLSNVNIVGDNITVTESNTTVIGDVIIQNGLVTSTATATEVEVEIGAWDMDATNNVFVTHGLSATEFKTVRNIDVTILDDTNQNLYKLAGKDLEGLSLTSTSFFLERVTGANFDNTNFNDAVINRGFIKYNYTSD